MLFLLSESDLNLCAEPNGFNCKENFHQEECGQMEGATFQNYGCKSINPDEYPHFECANRKDKENVLFKKPPLSTGLTLEATFYNDLLSFDNYTIYCGSLNFTYEDLFKVSQEHGKEDCTLLDGQKVRIRELWRDLKHDFSFKNTQRINELL